ncbi:hypothetical protein PIROE2DRAFT_8573, partial [Piromyces sp. E2]
MIYVVETTDKIIQIQQKANEYVVRASYLTSKNMNYNRESYLRPENITELPSLYHIVGSFVENNRNQNGSSSSNSNTPLEVSSSSHNNFMNSNNYNYSDFNYSGFN